MGMNNCPIVIKGSSTTSPPIQVKINNLPINTQKQNCFKGLNGFPRLTTLLLEGLRRRGVKKTRIAPAKARTPISLSGILRRMA